MKQNHPHHFLFSLAGVTLAGSLSAATYIQDFTAPDGTVNGGLGDGSFIASDITSNPGEVSTGQGPGSIQSNALRLTQEGVGSTRSSFRVPALANSSLGWTATFDVTLSAGGRPADGFTFNYGAIPDFNGVSGQVGNSPLNAADRHGNAEGGAGSGNEISFQVDTWQNTDINNPPGVAILVNGGILGGARTDGQILPDGGSVTASVSITWNPTDVSYSTTGLDTDAAFANVGHTFAGDDNFVWSFSARTGGATEDLIIDNLSITTVPEPSGVALLGLGLVGLLRRRR